MVMVASLPVVSYKPGAARKQLFVEFYLLINLKNQLNK
jgi:hypothetical protein